MDKRTTEKVIVSSSSGYDNLHKVFIQNEENLQALSNEFQNKPIGMLKTDALFGFLRFSSKLNRLMFEWVKVALDDREKRTDAKEDKLQVTVEKIDSFMEEYGSFLAKWKNEEQVLSSKVEKIGSRRKP